MFSYTGNQAWFPDPLLSFDSHLEKLNPENNFGALILEAEMGIEPMHNGFADHRVATSPLGPMYRIINFRLAYSPLPMMLLLHLVLQLQISKKASA